jgi:IclR family KDG regulon transcriptional repressor
MTSKHSQSSEDRYRLQTVERALSVLQAFLRQTPNSELNLTEISQRAGLSESTTFRFLVTLKKAGYLEQTPATGKYRLGVACLALGDAYLRNNDLRQRAYSTLVDLRDQCGETVHLAFLDGAEIVYLDKLAGLHPIGLMSSRAGGRAPAYCTGLGKALLAYASDAEISKILDAHSLIRFTEHTITDVDQLIKELKKVREAGYAEDREEHEVGAGCIACPVFDHHGVVAAISVSGPVDRIFNHEAETGLVRLVKDKAHEVSAHMGGDFYAIKR